MPIGTFNEGTDVTLWAGVSPHDFRTLTVTQEQADGNQASSGQRVLVAHRHAGLIATVAYARPQGVRPCRHGSSPTPMNH